MEISGYQNIKTLEYWDLCNIKTMEYQDIEISGYWNIMTLKYWSMGISRYGKFN